jgi:hypothetical protein
MGEVIDATERAIDAAGHLTDMDAGAIETLRALARKIDGQDEYFEALADVAAERKLRPPSPDNVSIPTYLKFCESLGLTPAGRVRLADQKSEGGGGSKLGSLQAQAAKRRRSA